MTSNPNTGSPTTAVWEATIEKYYNGEYWVNHYYLDVADLLAAYSAALDIMELERAVTYSTVTFTKVSARTTADLDYIFQTGAVNLPGLGGGVGQMMPLFVVARCDFTVTASRPSRKYLRGVLSEDSVTGMTLTPDTVTYINTNYVTPLVNMAAYVDKQGQPVVGGACSPNTGMRQLRRGSKKRPPHNFLAR